MEQLLAEQLSAKQSTAKQSTAKQSSARQSTVGDLAADEPAPDVPKPLDEPVPPDTADAFSWSARRVLPRSTAAPTAPIPKFTPTTWSILVTSDRAYYEQKQVERARMGWDLAFPAYTAERRFPLTGKQMRIGRRSAARGVEPEIDLSVPPADPGISRLHALLIAAPDGTWAVLDPGSANGTLLNGREIAPGDLIPLRDGDRINLGAWTAITVHRE
jgi:FHA domain